MPFHRACVRNLWQPLAAAAEEGGCVFLAAGEVFISPGQDFELGLPLCFQGEKLGLVAVLARW